VVGLVVQEFDVFCVITFYGLVSKDLAGLLFFITDFGYLINWISADTVLESFTFLFPG